MQQPDIERARAVKAAHEADLLRKANVLAVGVGFAEKYAGQVCIIVSVSRKLSASQLAPQDLLPRQIEGVPLVVRQVGELSALE